MKLFFIVFSLIGAVYAAENSVKDLNFSFEDFEVIDGKEVNPSNVEPKKQVKVKKPEAKLVTEKTKEEKIDPSSFLQKSTLDEFFDKSVKAFDKLKFEGEKFFGDINLDQIKSKKKIQKRPEKGDPALAFPDPTFYDAIYKKESRFITYSYIYNDKSNKDNLHIPEVKHHDLFREMLNLVKKGETREAFYEVFAASSGDSNFNIDSQDEFGNTLLLTALRNNNMEVFIFLLSKKADPSLCNNAEICPIQMAVFSNNISAIRALCEKNVDIRVRDKNELTVLQYTILNDRKTAFGVLLKRYLKYTKNPFERDEILYYVNKFGSNYYIEALENQFLKNENFNTKK